MRASCIVSAGRWLGTGWAGALLRLLAAVNGGQCAVSAAACSIVVCMYGRLCSCLLLLWSTQA